MKDKVIKAIVLAGGSSKRINSAVPKQLVKIKHKPLLAYTLDVFVRCKPISGIILVVNKKFLPQFHNLIKRYNYQKVEQLVIGGKTRQESVFNALQKIKDCDYVVIHDGVRPFVTGDIILRIIKAVKKFSAVSCAVKATDTIVEEKASLMRRTLRRNSLWHLQTPQAFRFNLILQAHQKAKAKGIINASDDAQLLMRLKNKVKFIAGGYRNIKVTTPWDLLLARSLIKNYPQKR